MLQLPFDLIEYQTRYAKLKKEMISSGIDASLLLGGNNIYYFCGFPAPGLSTPRPYFLLLPVSGNPVFLVHTGRVREAKIYNLVEDVRAYDTLTQLPPELSAIIEEAGLSKATIGCEMGTEMIMNLPLDQLEVLKAQFPKVRFTDASRIIWNLRSIKSEAELACHKEACRITSAVYSDVLSQLITGITQNEVYKQFHIRTLELGGGNQFVVLNSGKGTYDLASGLPSDKKLENGDMLWIDAGCAVRRYWSDFSRAAIIGKASPKQKSMHQRIVDITQDCLSMIKPGVLCSELAGYCNKQIDLLSESITSSISGLAGRCGHSLGLEITEPPHIAEYDNRLLEPGMVITIEPGVATEYGSFHFEQNVIITPQGHEIISTISQNLFEVPL